MRHNYSSVWRGLVMVGAVALGLMAGLLRAQVGTQYSFTASNGSYTAISGGTVLGDANNDDDIFTGGSRFTPPYATYPEGLSDVGIPIGFTFRLGLNDYTHFAVQTNGCIYLGTSSARQFNLAYNTVYINSMGPTAWANDAGFNQCIAGLQTDMVAKSGSSLRYEVVGSAPNRQLVVQWSDYDRYGSSGPVGETYNFQIRLSESSNEVALVYGTTTSIMMNPNASPYIVGLRGGGATDIHLIGGVPSAPSRMTDVSSINNYFLMNSSFVFASGRTFTFTRSTTSLETDEVAVSDLRAFPTLMNDYLNVKGNVTRSGNLQLVLTDATGRTHQVRQVNGASGQLDERMAVSDLAPGFYVLDVRSGASSQRIKLVKQ